MNPRRRRFGWILGGGDPWSSWTLAATANLGGLRRQLRWPVRRVEGASIHPRGWCRDLVPTLVNRIIPHRIPTTLIHLANALIYILCFATDQCHFCLVGGIQHLWVHFLGGWPVATRVPASCMWHLASVSSGGNPAEEWYRWREGSYAFRIGSAMRCMIISQIYGFIMCMFGGMMVAILFGTFLKK